VGGTGVDLYSLKESAVHMMSEDILLTHDEGAFRVVARYTFENPTEKEVKLQVGFPEVGCPKESEGDCHAKAFRGLETKVDGKLVTHRKGSLKQTEQWAEHLGTFWLFDVTFPAQKRVTILHQYSMDATLDSMGGVSVLYVTRTGATWAKPIGRAKFRFRVPPYATYLRSNEMLGEPKNPRFVKDGNRAFTEVTFEKENWTPPGDLEFSFATAFGQFPVPRLENSMLSLRAEELGVKDTDLCPWEGVHAESEVETDVQAQSCRNWIYARWGYPFEKKELRDLYYAGGKDWHVSTDYGPGALMRDPAPLPEFSIAWTSQSERKILEGIRVKKDASENPIAREVAKSVTPPAAEKKSVPQEVKSPAARDAARAKSGCSFSTAAERSLPTGIIWLLAAGMLVLRRERAKIPERGN